jgi:uncharacterized phage-associated protein
MMVDSVQFAQYILYCTQQLNKTRDTPLSMGETKLQKLIYICDGLLLAIDIHFINENARAWNYGPVYPRVHKWYGKEGKITPVDYSEAVKKAVDALDIQPLIDGIINSFGQWTAQSLSNWSHQPGSPWEKALERGKGKMNSIIDKNDMKEYFKEFVHAEQG